MKKLIENYRGFDIEFCTAQEKFICTLTGGLEKQSVNYSSIKKHIDEYKKENSDFMPFFIIGKPNEFETKGKKNVVGIRKDGRFICEDPLTGEKNQLSIYDESMYMIYNPLNDLLFQELDRINKDRDEAMRRLDQERKAVISKMVIVELKGYQP